MVGNSLSSHAVAFVLILIVLNLNICLTKESHHNIWYDWKSSVKRDINIEEVEHEESWHSNVGEATYQHLCTVPGFGKCQYHCSCTNNFTCSVLIIRFFFFNIYTYMYVCIYIHVFFLNSNLQVRYTQKFVTFAQNEVFSKMSLTFFLGLGLLRLCFHRKSIPFSNTVKPMTLATGSQDKRLHSVYFMITEKTITSALSLILGSLTS